MDLSQYSTTLSTICGVAIDLSGVAVPAVSDFQQRFYDSRISGAARSSLAYGISSVRFNEVQKESVHGDYYEQTVDIQITNNDHLAIDRMLEIKKAQYVYVRTSNYRELVIGRNDHGQNRSPRITIERNEQVTSIKFFAQSIMPAGFSDSNINLGLPHDVPVYLFD
jgi:hypothetical protein